MAKTELKEEENKCTNTDKQEKSEILSPQVCDIAVETIR